MPLDSNTDCAVKGSPVQTDAQATALLPSCSAAARSYQIARDEGKSPAEAFDEVMALWRELHYDARPMLRRPKR